MRRLLSSSILQISAVTAVVAAMVFGAPTTARAGGFDDQFSSTALASDWTVVGTTNWYSLTANPGHLRYGVNTGTHADGFLTDFAGYNDGANSYVAGTELRRTLTGAWWTLETKADYYMPSSNGRALVFRVYFGTGATGTYYADLFRWRDTGRNWTGWWGSNGLRVELRQKTGMSGTFPLTTVLEPYTETYAVDAAATSPTSTYFRLVRAGGVLTAFVSTDGSTWTQAWSHDLGTALDGLTQTVVATGHSWYANTGSYADYDYVTVSDGGEGSPTFAVEVNDDAVFGGFGTGWQGPVSVSIDRAGTVTTFTDIPTEDGMFGQEFGAGDPDYTFDFQTGDVVTVEGADGTTKHLLLSPIEVTTLGFAPDALAGTCTPALGPVAVWDADTSLTVDCSEAGTFDTLGAFDVPVNSYGDAGQWDADGDGVFWSWHTQKVDQTITLPTFPDRTIGVAPFTITGTTAGDSGNPVVYGATGSCTVTGDVVTLTGVGTCTITADQAGNDTYNDASQVSASFAVSYATQALGDLAKPTKKGSTTPLKIQLRDSAGTNLSSSAIVVKAVSLDGVSLTGGQTFRYMPEPPGYYQYNVKSTGLTSGTHTLVYTAGSDPTQHSVTFTVR